MKLKNIYLFLIFLFLLSCKGEEDSYIYPSVKLEFISAQTDNSGKIISLKTDKDSTYQVENDRTSSKLDANILQRIVCYYSTLSKATATENATAEIYSLIKTVSPTPGRLASGAVMKTDPVGIQSIWLSGDYINLTLQIKLQSQAHLFHFIETEVTQSNGVPSIHLTLYHDKNGDVEAYTKVAYLSAPLAKYIQQYPNGFTISFSINTFTEGVKTFTFTYPPATV
ncbi:NigD-like C-terminal domain-containing protein [uncultured Bacteroides sp.]|uniref:NigD1/NigD2 family lipoprotein n=1 Tax=uncultured Bacteroides sp. TaxID=162156 RepID=UPI002AAA78BF|nr:NigD-like C-terminal domain-containing protein [uncultured Bacteroides sp.]